jgi:CRP-like cAMP-binding protein
VLANGGSPVDAPPGTVARPDEGRSPWVETPLFTDDELALLTGSPGQLRIEAGTRLMTEGQRVEFVYMMQSGEVEVYRRTASRRVVVQILRAGDLIGAVPFLTRTTSAFSARTLSPVWLVRLRGEVLSRLLETRPSLAHRFMVHLSVRLDRALRRVEELARGDLRSRTAALLLDETEGRSGVIRLPQGTLAELLGASRSSVNRVLKDLEANGVVRLEYRRVEVLDPEGLRLASA